MQSALRPALPSPNTRYLNLMMAWIFICFTHFWSSHIWKRTRHMVNIQLKVYWMNEWVHCLVVMKFKRLNPVANYFMSILEGLLSHWVTGSNDKLHRVVNFMPFRVSFSSLYHGNLIWYTLVMWLPRPWNGIKIIVYFCPFTYFILLV